MLPGSSTGLLGACCARCVVRWRRAWFYGPGMGLRRRGRSGRQRSAWVDPRCGSGPPGGRGPSGSRRGSGSCPSASSRCRSARWCGQRGSRTESEPANRFAPSFVTWIRTENPSPTRVGGRADMPPQRSQRPGLQWSVSALRQQQRLGRGSPPGKIKLLKHKGISGEGTGFPKAPPRTRGRRPRQESNQRHTV